jgi:hypothetical protein
VKLRRLLGFEVWERVVFCEGEKDDENEKFEYRQKIRGALVLARCITNSHGLFFAFPACR